MSAWWSQIFKETSTLHGQTVEWHGPLRDYILIEGCRYKDSRHPGLKNGRSSSPWDPCFSIVDQTESTRTGLKSMIKTPIEKFNAVGTAAIAWWPSSKTNWISAEQQKDDAIEAVPQKMNHNEDPYCALSNLKHSRDKNWETSESNQCIKVP